MSLTPSTVDRVIRDQVPRLADALRSLQSLVKYVQADRANFVSAWRNILTEQSSSSALIAFASIPFVEKATSTWLSQLGEPDIGAHTYLERAAAWSDELYGDAIDLADQTVLWNTLRRALLPFLVSWFPVGPELDQAFAALDVLERALLSVTAAVGIERSQRRLAEGAHLRSVGRLTGGLAHALNNSMAVIVGRAQILEEQATSETFANELRAIQKTARTTAEALKQLQIYSGDWDGQHPTRLDINELVHQVVELTRFRWRDDTEANGIAIEVVQDMSPVPPVIGQAGILRDVLVELVLNSIEAMPLGGQLTIQTLPVDDRVQIAVMDAGEGMEPQIRARATEAYLTTKGTGHAGLGLTRVTDSVRQMGGTLTLESAAGKGTNAVIRLPVAANIRSAPDNLTARLVRWAKILIVDDEPLVVDVTARTFSLRGFRPVTATSGEQALQLFREQGPFEVVMVDLGMPGMNGFQTARAIKAQNSRTLVILMTGWAAELDSSKLREAGIDRAITKPFDADQVIQLISEGLALQEKI